jgi:dCMP deaminase
MLVDSLWKDPVESWGKIVDEPVNSGGMAELELDLPVPDRIPLEEVYMRMAEELAKRSTCARNQVGTVITNADLTQVLGIGYNGNARGLPNRCDSEEPGRCGCLHSEQNALVKAGATEPGKLMFVTVAPCVTCAKLTVNSNVARVYYRRAYRLTGGLDVLRASGVQVIAYDRYRDRWR